MDGWYWYAQDIKVPTLWDQVHAKGGVVASIGWPVSVGARSIDDNIVEYWRARTPDDVKLIRALSTPGLSEALEAASSQPLSGLAETTPDADEAKSRFAVALYQLKQPRLFTLHLSSLDEVQHLFGPDTPQAHEALERIDADIGRILAAARKVEPDLVVVIVSDHGFAPLNHEVNLYRPFIDAGLISVDPKTGKPTDWQAEPWGGASAAIVLAHPEDAALKAKVKALLDRLAADPELGVNRIIGGDEVARLGATAMASFYVDFKIGYEMGQAFDAPPVRPSLLRGMHGYFPDHPEMHSTFIVAGPGLTRKGSLGEIEMWRIAPTVAKILQVDLPSAEGQPLF
jgi:predicted AlkP superfamily pyrophosphatase or phosphodiesterase